MAERSDPPPGGGGTARPGAAIGGQPQQKKKKPKYPAGCPVVEVNGTFDITEPSSGATITVRRTGEGAFWLQLEERDKGLSLVWAYGRNLQCASAVETAREAVASSAFRSLEPYFHLMWW